MALVDNANRGLERRRIGDIIVRYFESLDFLEYITREIFIKVQQKNADKNPISVC